MDQNAARGGATLAGGSDGAKYDGGHRQIQIGVLIDDDGVVASQLEQALAEPLRDAHCDLAAHMSRTGKRQQRHPPIIDESAGKIGSRIDEHLKYRRKSVALQHAVANVLNRQRAQRGLWRGLPDGCVAGDRGQERIPRPYGHGKIER